MNYAYARVSTKEQKEVILDYLLGNLDSAKQKLKNKEAINDRQAN